MLLFPSLERSNSTVNVALGDMGQLGEHSGAKSVASKVFFNFRGSVTRGTKNQEMPP